MIFNTYPVFEKDGEEYVADTRIISTDSPQLCTAYTYRLKDKKSMYVSLSEAESGLKIMYEGDYINFTYGRSYNIFAIDKYDNIISGDFRLSSQSISVVHNKEKTTHERVLDLEEKCDRLFALMPNSTSLTKDEHFTDTERFDWMINNHARLAQKPDGTWVCEIIKRSGYRSIGDFKSAREAIDAAMEER